MRFLTNTYPGNLILDGSYKYDGSKIFPLDETSKLIWDYIFSAVQEGRIKLTDYVPEWIKNSKYFQAVYSAQQTELDTVNDMIEDLIAQCFVDSATWGLVLWEQIYAIETDESKPLDQRRSVVKAKMRGSGVITKAMIKNIAAAFLNGQVEVTENFEAVSIDITFTDYQGVPPNRDDLTKTLRELIPAHLGINYILEYLTWDAMDALNLTRDELDAMTLTWDQLEVYK